MSNPYFDSIKRDLIDCPRTWTVTGVAGFIGSNLLEELLSLNQNVIGLDNFSTGKQKNLEEVKGIVTESQWSKFKFHEGDITDLKICQSVTQDSDYVLHQAALGSVPRSIDDPINTNNSNINGFLNMISASKDNNVKNFIYAASSSTYGDHKELPKVEHVIGKPLSPYAVTKYVNELYAHVFFLNYGFKSIGLRYFNVFGKRQDPEGAYAAVIPKWFASFLKHEKVVINGDGENSRDFCYINNAVQANILSAVNGDIKKPEVFNIAVGERTTLNQLITLIDNSLSIRQVNFSGEVVHSDIRAGDVLHSLADINKAKNLLKYSPSHKIHEGIEDCIDWYLKKYL